MKMFGRVAAWLVGGWLVMGMAAVVLAPVFLGLLTIVAAAVGIVAFRLGRRRSPAAPARPVYRHAPFPAPVTWPVVTAPVVERREMPAPPVQNWRGPALAGQPAYARGAADAAVPDFVPTAWTEMHGSGDAER